MFTAPGHDAIVMELGRQVVEFDDGKIVEVRPIRVLWLRSGVRMRKLFHASGVALPGSLL